jgi:hypothetical protein
VSDTPRTDKILFSVDVCDGEDVVNLWFARNLERELNAANERIKRLEAVTNDPHALWVNWLRGSVTLPVGIGDVRQYQDRIKRLEEAGDAMVSHAKALGMDGTGLVKRWFKAKEAKP